MLRAGVSVHFQSLSLVFFPLELHLLSYSHTGQINPYSDIFLLAQLPAEFEELNAIIISKYCPEHYLAQRSKSVDAG